MIHVLSEGNNALCSPPWGTLSLFCCPVGHVDLWMPFGPRPRAEFGCSHVLCSASPPPPLFVATARCVSLLLLAEMFGFRRVSSCTGRQQGWMRRPWTLHRYLGGGV